MRPFLLCMAGIGLFACSSARLEPDPVDATKGAVRASPMGGFVSATVASFGPGLGPAVSIGATFWNETTDNPPCSTRTVEACVIRKCARGEAMHLLTSGLITVEADGTSPIRLSPDAVGHYPNPVHTASPWAAGAHVQLVSTGGDVPPFAARLTAPPPLEVLKPAVGTTVIDRAAGLRALWTAGQEGTVRIALRQQRSAARTALDGGVSIDCFYPRSAGAALVPAEALGDLDPSRDADAMVYSVDTARVRAGEHDVLVLVNTGGIWTGATIR